MRHRSDATRSPAPILYLITDRHLVAPALRLPEQLAVLREWLVRAARAGIDWIQIREKDLDSRTLCDFAGSIVRDTRRYGSKILVNERIDIALAAGADGVHLTSSSIPAGRVRELAGEKLLIGASTHSAAELASVESAADFAVLGPVFETASKAGYGPPLGLDRFAGMVRETRLPVIALGGIDETRVESAVRAGAAGVAGISMFANASNFDSFVARMRSVPRTNTDREGNS